MCASISKPWYVAWLTQGVPVRHVASQYSTDLQKCFQALDDREKEEGKGKYQAVIYGGLGGRLDQSVHSLHVLWQLAPTVPVETLVTEPQEEGKPPPRGSVLEKRERTVIVADGCVTCLLPQGEHVLWHDRSVFGISCGILPLGTGASGVHVHTSGLEWDLRTSVY